MKSYQLNLTGLVISIILLISLLPKASHPVSAQTNTYIDDFSGYPVGSVPSGWKQYGTTAITPRIVEFGGTGSAFHRLEFPAYTAEPTSKWLIKDALTWTSVTASVKLNFQTQSDGAGLVLGWVDSNNFIAILPNPFWDEIVVWEFANGGIRSTFGTGRFVVPIQPNQDYWLQATTKVSLTGDRQIDVFWSTDGSNYAQKVTATNLANLTGQAGVGTFQFLSDTLFDNFSLSPTTNGPPVARLTMGTTDQVVTANEGGRLDFTVSEGFSSRVQIFLSGQRSSDPDNDPLTYEWLLNGTNVGTSRDISLDLGEGVYDITLNVADDHGNQVTAQAAINITARNNTEALALTWPFIATAGWNSTAGYGEGSCKPGDHCGDDWFAQDWNWGGGQEDWGMVLLSPATGRVIWTGQSSSVTGYGNQVIIQDLDAIPYDYALRFTHLEEVWVTDGQLVCPGTPVGLLGFSGLSGKGSNVSHLHAASYMGLFQSSAKGFTGYHWLDTDGAIVASLSLSSPSRFAIRFQFDPAVRPQGCGDTFALEGRVSKPTSKTTITGIGGVTITLSGSQSSSKTTFGASSGHYAFNGLAPGSYTVTPSKTGCTFTPSSATISISSNHIQLPDFTASGAKCK